MNNPTFSIIIPFKSWSEELDECLAHIQKLSYSMFEVILLPDEEVGLPDLGFAIDIIPTGPISPAQKRDIGAKKAGGLYLAFIDDDAYPQSDWLDVANQILISHSDVGAIGGPGITPKNDPFWARVSGAFFLSVTSGGFPERYVSCPPCKSVDDWPSVNLIVRKSVYELIGGFDSNYWPGEDTLFCLKIIKQAELKILYVPNLVVWHHKRPGLMKHLRQVGNYGKHRGYFVKNYPETSCRIKYFIPTLWLVFVLLGVTLSSVSPWLEWTYLVGWLAYFIVLVFSWKEIMRFEPITIAIGATPYIFLSHLWYGGKFLEGLLSSELKRSLGR
ncbi:MAG TPA: glycosyl transferase [Nitrospinaceae bacterium]|nr:glycosyl transferase [Nitrospinaceae bacterium]